jgi:predicted GTPase
MSRWRIFVVLALISAPVVFLALVGSYYLWQQRLGFWLWWPMAVCLGLGYLLAWHWHRKQRLLKPADFSPPMHWTARDKEAWKLVEVRARAAPELQPDQLTTFDFYVTTAKEMSLELARFYHPHATDPVAHLTIPEMLAVIELSSHDMSELVEDYLPGGHLLTIRDFRRARAATEWYYTANKVYWAVSALLAPVNTGLRYLASQVGLSRPLQVLQQNLLVWFYVAYLQRLGTYLIDLNSGRLRVGADRYREILREAGDRFAPPPAQPHREPSSDGVAAEPAVPQAPTVQVTVLGQVKTGKSSLINALLGEQRARTDVIPATAEITRYELKNPDLSTTLMLLDTVGYANTGPREDQLRATQRAAQESDLLLLVLHARNPARQADLDMLRHLRAWFESRPDLKQVPILAVMTHIDLLTPSLEWSPPYNWKEPTRPKEQHIHDALRAAVDQVGDHVTGIIPVCTAEGKVYGVEEWLLPAIANQLDEAHAVGLLRCLRAEIDARKIRRVFEQMLSAGKGLARAIWEMRPR